MNPVLAHEAVSAFAGSGKTFALSHRYIHLLGVGMEPDRINAMTFSRKAAAEIFDSVVTYLRKAASDPADAARTAASARLPGFGPDDFLGILKRFTRHLHRVHIGTLDGFAVGIVRAFPAELGIPAQFDLADEKAGVGLDFRAQVIRQILTQSDRSARRAFLESFKQSTFGREEKTLLRALDEYIGNYLSAFRAFPEAARWGDESSIWPAGSLWRGVRGSQADYDALVAEMNSPGVNELFRNAVVKLADACLMHAPGKPWPKDAGGTVLERALDQVDALQKGPVEIAYRKKSHALKHGPELFRLLGNLLGSELARAAGSTRGIGAVLEIFEGTYDRAAKDRGLLTFEDVQYLLAPAKLSRKQGADRLFIDFRLDATLDHWLIDEFQDTSDLQWRVLANLIDEALQDNSGNRSVYCVGDLKQSIYGWRGGNPEIFNQLMKRLKVDHLKQSYRSCQTVLDAVNAVFGKLPEEGLPKEAVKYWQDDRVWTEHRAADSLVGVKGYVTLRECPRVGSRSGMADRLPGITSILSELKPVENGLEVAILVRTHNHAREVAEAVSRELPGLPFTYEAKKSISDNPVVALLVSMTRYAQHPGDGLARQHLMMSPLWPALLAAAANRPGRVRRVLLNQIHADGFRAFVEAWGLKLSLDDFGRRRLMDLIEAAAAFDATGQRDALAFERHIEQWKAEEATSKGVVRIMTVHQSKGLGFDAVILPSLDDMEFGADTVNRLHVALDPVTRAPRWVLRMPRKLVAENDPVLRDEQGVVEVSAALETLCGGYVAMTRAKQGLYMLVSARAASSKGDDKGVESLADLMRNALGDDVRPTGDAVCLHERGDPGWYLGGRSASVQVRGELLWPPRDEWPTPVRPMLHRVEPSGQESFKQAASRLFEAKASRILDFGTAIHAMLERVEWIEDADAAAIVASWEATADVDANVKRDVIAQFSALFERAEVRAVLARRNGVELWRERRFDVVVAGNRVVTGMFDRVMVRRDAAGHAEAATIVDYKSDQVDSGAEADRAVTRHTPQLREYRSALAGILGIEEAQIGLTLLFTRPGRVRTIS